MTSYDFAGGPQWGSVYPMGAQSQHGLLPQVSHAPPPPVQSPWDHSSPYRLTVKQQPERAKAANAKDKDRKPIDPPPILQLDVDPNQDPLQVYITSPYLFVQTFLIGADESNQEPELNSLTGNTCTSGHVVKDDRGVHNMMFCLNDISVKKEGTYRLKFCLFKLNTSTGEVENLTSICSHPFTTYSGRHFPGMAESTSMTRLLVDAGVRLRLRKESKAMSTKKKNNAFAQMMSRRGGDDDDDRPVKRMRSEPHDKDPVSTAKHGSFSSAPHSYTTHSTPTSLSQYPGSYGHPLTSSPGHTNMTTMHSMSGGYNSGMQLGVDTQVSHYHSSPSAGSSYQSPGRQSPTTTYPLHSVSAANSQGLVPSSNSLAQFSSSHSAQQPVLPPVDMGGSHGSSSPDLNYTTSANYNGAYMPSQSGGSRTLPGMQHRSASFAGPGHMPMRLGLQSGHGGYGESSMFEFGGYGPRDGH